MRKYHSRGVLHEGLETTALVEGDDLLDGPVHGEDGVQRLQRHGEADVVHARDDHVGRPVAARPPRFGAECEGRLRPRQQGSPAARGAAAWKGRKGGGRPAEWNDDGCMD